MAIWITCLRDGDVQPVTPMASHDEIHHALDDMLDRHSREGRSVRNVLRDDGQPAWDVLDPKGSVLATYWIARGSQGVRN